MLKMDNTHPSTLWKFTGILAAMLVVSAVFASWQESDLPGSSAAPQNATPVSDAGRRYKHFVDVGTLKPGDRIPVTFEVSNTTTSPWRIGKIKTTCGCLSVKVNQQIVAPGSSLSGTAVTRASRVNESVPYRSYAEIQLKEQPATIWVEFSGHIQPDLTIAPNSLEFSSYSTSSKPIHRATVEYHAGEGDSELIVGEGIPDWVTSLEITPKADSANAKFKPKSRAWDVAISWDPSLISRSSRADLRFEIAGNPSIGTSLSCTTSVSSGLQSVFPSQLFFGTIPVEHTSKRKLVFQPSNRSPERVDFKEDFKAVLSPELEHCGAVDVQTNSNRVIVLSVSLTPVSTGRLKGSLICTSQDGTVEYARVPVLAESVTAK